MDTKVIESLIVMSVYSKCKSTKEFINHKDQKLLFAQSRLFMCNHKSYIFSCIFLYAQAVYFAQKYAREVTTENFLFGVFSTGVPAVTQY